MKISIIIPIYNGAKYLENTISSLLEQPYKDIELILVNDGSTDNSRAICEIYRNLDDRVILINQDNRGISAARNAGLEVASGEYISFIDQDDRISEDIYQILTSNIRKDVDLVISGKVMRLIDENGKLINEVCYEYEDATYENPNKMFRLIMNINHDMCLLHIWNCLYRKSIIVRYNIRFNTRFRFGHEDSLFNIEYFSHCNSVMLKKGVVYYYSRRKKTSTSLKNNIDYIDNLKIYSEIANESFKKNLAIKSNRNILYTYFIRLGLSLFKQYSCGKKKERCDDLKTIIELSQNIANSQHISCEGIGIVYSLYLNIIVILTKRGFTGLAIWLLDRTKNM